MPCLKLQRQNTDLKVLLEVLIAGLLFLKSPGGFSLVAEKFNKGEKIPERNQGGLEESIAEAKRLLNEAKGKKHLDEEDPECDAPVVSRR